ncbi:hypothetical protein AX14_003436 [Amanita brunnescens Koide BX004]|nr:hypothetical protein AX14_003436 [Amanita brunnescens Koide BX004]
MDPASGVATVPDGDVKVAATMTTTGEAEPKERESIEARLPARAGFDFAAIKQVIGSSDKETAAKNGVAGAHRSVPAVPEEDLDSSKPKVGDRLTSLFRRSSSTSSLVAPVEEKEDNAHRLDRAQTHSHEDEFGGFESASAAGSKMLLSTPNLSFADDAGSVWGEEEDPPPLFSVSSPLASVSTSHLASGRMPSSRLDIIDRSSSAPRVSYGIPASPITPPPSAPGSRFMQHSLSFGGADGSITTGSGSGLAGGDPWSAPLTLDHGLNGRKRTANTGFDPNPWS